MWPPDLKSVELVGGMNLTELWMLKERIDAGHAAVIDGPEPVFGKTGKYYTIFATGDQAYTVLTNGLFGAGQNGIDAEWCCVIRVNKISVARVHEIRSWKYE